MHVATHTHVACLEFSTHYPRHAAWPSNTPPSRFARRSTCTQAGTQRGQRRAQGAESPRAGPARLFYWLQEAENFLSATTTSASTTQVASRAAITMAAMAPGPSDPPSWSTLAGGVLSSGAGAEVGNGGPETANSCLWLVLSRGPSPEDNSIGSFHKVGLGSWGPSAAKSKIDSGTQVVWAGMPTLPNRSTKGCPTPHSTRPGIGLGNSLSL